MATKKREPSKKAGKIAAKKDAAKALRDFFEDGLKDIYWAEKAMTKALPLLYKNASSPKLKKAISDHLVQTNNHVKRLEDCFAALGKKPRAQKCDAMQGLLEESKGILKETKPGPVRDVGIIAAAQKAEHYEIATYGTLAAYAKVLDEKRCLVNLLLTLRDEKKCDAILTGIADTALNTEAMGMA